MNALANDPDVLWVEFNFTSRAPEGRPRYFFTSSVAQPKLVDAPALPQGLKMQPNVCATGNAITVAVLDTGVDTTHPAIADNILANGVNMLEISRDVSDAGNGIDDDGDGRVDEMVGHGTHVSGTVVQVAPDAQILPVKVLDSDGNGDTFSVMAGVVYAVEQGADVINLSLGSTWDSTALAWAVRYAEEQGIVVVAAAGNGNHSTPVEFPASDDGVISVAATNADGDKAEYSNYNQYISAPGDNVASAYPNGLYATASGTSMSAPIVSGSVALMLDDSPGMEPRTVRDRVFDTAAPLNLSDPTMDGMMGGGEIDIDATLVCGD
jgi:subtilisin family serine protease